MAKPKEFKNYLVEETNNYLKECSVSH
jgi:hypothetical protein